MRTAYRTCPICDAICGLRLTLDDDGKVLSVRGDQDDPFSKGYICPKGASLGQLDEDPDRLRRPMIRTGEQWREASWEEAFAEIDRGLSGVIEAHGRQSVATYFGNPTFHTMGGILYRGALAQAVGSPNVYSASSIDQLPKHVACGLMFGNGLGISVPDVDRTDYLFVLGANPAESHGSLAVAPDFPGRLKALRRRGGKLVVVDPRRTRTADMADEHVFSRPGTDSFLLFGIVHTLLAENLTSVDLDVEGMDELRELAAEFSPEAVAPACGVPAATIERLARELAAAPTAAVYSRVGSCTADFSTLSQWLVDVINILTGNFDRPGGVMFAKAATLQMPWGPKPFTYGRWQSRVRGLPEMLDEFPVATLADEIETPGEGQVRALLAVAGNLVLSAPNGPRLGKAMQSLEFMVCVDPYLNETTKLANVILPPPRMLQMPHYDLLETMITVRNYARFSTPALPLEDDQMSEEDIMARLVLIAMGKGADADPAEFHEMLLGGLLGLATQLPGSSLQGADPGEVRAGLEGNSPPELMLDALLKAGPYRLTLADLRAKPSGIDLGALEPRLPEVLCTPEGRVRMAPPELVPEVERLRGLLDTPAPDMVLIGRRQLRSNNSWLHNVPSLVGGSNSCTLQVNPGDVAKLGLGSHARVRSAVGEVIAPVEPTETIMPGVVSLPHGWGHAGSDQRVAARHPGVNVNALTDSSTADPISGNAVFNGVPVTVSPAPDSVAAG
ncbi:molybdopterin oxidoreductase family protein [Jatrophihabitans sp.]|uniref:molybdopterin oxidoreductase family protein n=1 Tax=Jatrophihabitans sp. TaxID=1932789 RepID=UPI002CE4E491|nr:molybdopterin oxidoreductase family protein [Jatrophihabitans sp.]